MLTVFTDGSCVGGNPGNAGAGYAIAREGKLLEACGIALGRGTNNVGELTGIAAGLEAAVPVLEPGESVELVTDSQYALRGMRELHKYAVRGKPNMHIWERISRAVNMLSGHAITCKWVRGHSDCKGNELCDQMARESAHKQEDYRWETN